VDRGPAVSETNEAATLPGTQLQVRSFTDFPYQLCTQQLRDPKELLASKQRPGDVEVTVNRTSFVDVLFDPKRTYEVVVGR
jgi:hypothetical protein